MALFTKLTNMNPVGIVELDVNRVISNFELLQDHCDKCLSDIIDEVHEIQKEIIQSTGELLLLLFLIAFLFAGNYNKLTSY